MTVTRESWPGRYEYLDPWRGGWTTVDVATFASDVAEAKRKGVAVFVRDNFKKKQKYRVVHQSSKPRIVVLIQTRHIDVECVCVSNAVMNAYLVAERVEQAR